MPMNRELYPDNWDAIAMAVKNDASWRCQQCSIPHRWDGTHGSILTVHHWDRNPANCSRENLVALCARCHLRVEARARKLQKLAVANSAVLALAASVRPP
jgi:5-methylcytosine-specific restriction endonuclease McrA